jgi:hypothetical protein
LKHATNHIQTRCNTFEKNEIHIDYNYIIKF